MKPQCPPSLRGRVRFLHAWQSVDANVDSHVCCAGFFVVNRDFGWGQELGTQRKATVTTAVLVYCVQQSKNQLASGVIVTFVEKVGSETVADTCRVSVVEILGHLFNDPAYPRFIRYDSE